MHINFCLLFKNTFLRSPKLVLIPLAEKTHFDGKNLPDAFLV